MTPSALFLRVLQRSLESNAQGKEKGKKRGRKKKKKNPPLISLPLLVLLSSFLSSLLLLSSLHGLLDPQLNRVPGLDVPGLPGGHLGDQGQLLVALMLSLMFSGFFRREVDDERCSFFSLSSLSLLLSLQTILHLIHLLRQGLELETELVLDLGVGRVRVDGGETVLSEKKGVEVEIDVEMSGAERVRKKRN